MAGFHFRWIHGALAVLGEEPSNMQRTWFLLVAIATLAVVVTALAFARARSDETSAPVFVTTIPPGYRDWKLISVAHEEGNLHDIRAILGNDAAFNAYRNDKLPFPNGAIIARLAWAHVPSEENNKVFGREQSYVAGAQPDWYLQFMVKDSTKYAATGGWGYAQFDKDGKPASEEKLRTCFPCHQPVQSRDFVFTRYAP